MKSRVLLVISIALLLLQVPALSQEETPAPYESYLNDTPGNTTEKNANVRETWTGGDSNAAEQRYQQPDAEILPGLTEATPKVPTKAIREVTKELIDETTFLSTDNDPYDSPKPLDRIYTITLVAIGVGFGLIGGLIGAGIEVIRAKYGKQRSQRKPVQIPKSPPPPPAP